MEDIETKYLYKFLIKFYFSFLLFSIIGLGMISYIEWNKQEKCFELLKTAPEHNKEMVWKKCNE